MTNTKIIQYQLGLISKALLAISDELASDVPIDDAMTDFNPHGPLPFNKIAAEQKIMDMRSANESVVKPGMIIDGLEPVYHVSFEVNTPTHDDLKAALLDVAKKHDKATAKSVLLEFGANKISDVAEDKIADVIAELKVVL
jgi:hypothetical protein